MSKLHPNWVRNCSDKRLLELLSDADRLKAEGKPVPSLVEALMTEAAFRARYSGPGICSLYAPWYF